MDCRVEPTTVRHGLCLMECTTLILLVSRSLRINWTRERSNAVPHQNIVFHGLLKHIPWTVLDRLVEEHHADPDPRGPQDQSPSDRDVVWAAVQGARPARDRNEP